MASRSGSSLGCADRVPELERRLDEAPSLTSEALSPNVNIATPTTLMIALRTAASVWQVERRNQNAARAGQLYDKFVGFSQDMATLGDRLRGAQRAYDETMGKLTSGNGNVVRQVEMLNVLGARTSKILAANLLETIEEPATESETETELAAE